jgi:hypothetical protein
VLDEFEMFQGGGLSESAAKDLLIKSTNELLRTGQFHKARTAFSLPLLGRTIHIVNYPAAAPAGRMLEFHELQN